MSRDRLMEMLEADGVETRTFFYPIHVQPVYATPYQSERFPVAEELSKKGINLPSGNNLTTEKVEMVCRCIISCFKNRSKKSE